MGSGRFTEEAFIALKRTKSYDDKSRDQIFTAREMDPEMDPRTVEFRESRDSVEHPESVPIIVGLDVTGSMGFVPEEIVKKSLPDLVGTIIQAGIPDPQVLFLGIGDFVYDDAPLQIGQFESSAELLDRWLTKVYLEGGGGGNNCESYNLAWLVGARHTKTDAWEKRKKKGFIFTIGDEPCAPDIPGEIISRLTPEKRAKAINSKTLMEEASERYNLFHIHLEHDGTSAKDYRKEGWRDLLGQRFITLDDYTRLAKLIAQLVIDNYGEPSSGSASSVTSGKPVEDML
jgi:hypothetical protein